MPEALLFPANKIELKVKSLLETSGPVSLRALHKSSSYIFFDDPVVLQPQADSDAKDDPVMIKKEREMEKKSTILERTESRIHLNF